MSDDDKKQIIRSMGLAPLKREGGMVNFETGKEATHAERTAYEAVRSARLKASSEFDRLAAAGCGDILRPKWLFVMYQLATEAEDRDYITWLRRLVLRKMASGEIEDLQRCAAIVMPIDEVD